MNCRHETRHPVFILKFYFFLLRSMLWWVLSPRSRFYFKTLRLQPYVSALLIFRMVRTSSCDICQFSQSGGPMQTSTIFKNIDFQNTCFNQPNTLCSFLLFGFLFFGLTVTSASAETKTPSPRPTSPRSTSDKNYNAVNDFVRSREATAAPSTAPNTVINEQQLKLEMQQNIQQQKLDLNHKLNTTPNSAQ